MMSHSQIQSKLEDKKPEESKESALIKHIASFADPQTGYVDFDSMYHILLNTWHLSNYKAWQIAFGVMIAAHTSGVPGASLCHGKFLPKDALSLMHPMDTGLYVRNTGEFNQALFDSIPFSEDKNGTKIISKSDFDAFFKKRQADDHRWDGVSSVGKYLGKTGHEGEIGLLFTKCFSQEINKTDYITKNDLETFYKDTKEIAERVKKNELPTTQALKI